MNLFKTRILLSASVSTYDRHRYLHSKAQARRRLPLLRRKRPRRRRGRSQEASPSQPKADKKPDQAAAYYHFALAHMYEEMMAMYGRSEYATKAIEEYRLAIENDPSSEYLNASLAELYAKTGRIRDAVLEAQEIIKRDPDNLEAHKLLGRIYLRSLGDLQPGTQSREVLTLAIEQYEAMVGSSPRMRTTICCWAACIS